MIKAQRSMKYYAAKTDWPDHFHKVCTALGFTDQYPTANEFVRAVWKWQASHPPLKADGILGPKTWQSMREYVLVIGENRLPPGGSVPEWLTRLVPWPGTSKGSAAALPQWPAPPPPPTPAPTPPVAEDLVLKEALELDFKRKDVYAAYEVSGAYAARPENRLHPVIETTKLHVPALRVGDVWPGMKGGNRIIVGLVPIMGWEHATQLLTTSAEIVFVTDSGRAYVQRLEGWEADYFRGLGDDLKRALGPIQTFLEVEIEFLVGFLSSLHPVATVYFIGMGLAQWLVVNKEPLGKMKISLMKIAAASAALALVAPLLHNKIVWGMFKGVLAELPAATVKNHKAMARFVGQMVAKLGLAALKRDATVLLHAVKPVIKQVLQALAIAAKTVKSAALPAATAAGKSLPAAVAAAAKQLAIDLQPHNVMLNPNEASQIVQEIQANPEEVRKQLELLTAALHELSAAAAEVK
jgi:hypothetical protein